MQIIHLKRWGCRGSIFSRLYCYDTRPLLHLWWAVVCHKCQATVRSLKYTLSSAVACHREGRQPAVMLSVEHWEQGERVFCQGGGTSPTSPQLGHLQNHLSVKYNLNPNYAWDSSVFKLNSILFNVFKRTSLVSSLSSLFLSQRVKEDKVHSMWCSMGTVGGVKAQRIHTCIIDKSFFPLATKTLICTKRRKSSKK